MLRHSHAVAVLTLVALAGSAHAQTWVGGAYGDWSDASNWSSGTVPTAGGSIYINTNSRVTYNIPTSDFTTFYLGSVAGQFGHFFMDQGEIDTTSASIGFVRQGILEVNGTGYFEATSLNIAVLAGSSGSVTVDGGEIKCNGLNIGQSGVGDFVLHDGYVKCTSADIASQAGSTGVFVQYGGLFETGWYEADRDGEGVSWFAGGVANISRLDIGKGTTGPMGKVYITDTAEVNAPSRVYVGLTDAGRLEMTGGSLTTYKLEAQVSAGSYAEISLQGGDLSARSIRYLTGAPPSFEMTGGSLSAETFGELSEPWDLLVAGGTVLPHGDDLDFLSVRGAFILGIPGAVRFQLDNPGSSDDLIVYGDVSLQGSLELQIEGPVFANEQFLIIDSLGPNPILGAFAGLPEGGTTTVLFGSLPYEFEITYLGGDGNDVVLTLVNCPPDINNDGFLDGGDISLFVDLFLAGSLSADFNADGFLDGGDISEYIDQYLAGC